MNAPIRVGVTVNMAEAGALLKSIEQKVHDLRPAFYRIDADVSELLREQFDSRGARLGTTWRPLNPRTIRARTQVLAAKGKKGARTVNLAGRARAGFATPMRDTNRLWASYIKPQGPESLRVMDRLRYERGSRVPYAASHQPGGIVVPSRPVIPKEMPAPVVRTWEGYLAQYITQGTVS